MLNFSFSDLVDYIPARFDYFIVTECKHLKDLVFIKEIRKILSVSALIFFLLIQIPLSRYSSLFSLLTAFIPCILDKNSKENIYLFLNRLVTLVTFKYNDPEWKTEILRKNSSVSKKMGIS